MWIPVEQIKQIIRRQALGYVSITSSDGGSQIDYLKGDVDALCERVDAWERSLDVPFIVMAWADGMANDVGGRKSPGRREFTWRVMGQKGMMNGQPGPGHPLAPQIPAGVSQAEVERLLAVERMRWDSEANARTIQDLRQRLDELENGEPEDEDEDEDEDDDEKVNGSPVQIERLSFDNLLTLVREFRSGGLKGPSATEAGKITGNASAPDAELLRAIERLKQHEPDNFKQYTGSLLGVYGDAPYKAAMEQASNTNTDGGAK